MRGKSYPKSVAEYIDYDYEHRLLPTEAAWLAKFTDNYYGATFDKSDTAWSREQRRATYQRKNAANRDLFTKYKRER